MKGSPPPQVTTGGPPRQEERDSGTEGSRVYFASARLGHCPSRAEAALVFRLLSEPSLLSFHASPFSCSLCSAGARKSRRRPLKRDHSRGSSQQPPPHPNPPPSPPFLQNIPWLRRSCAGARGQASAARGPQRCRLRCGQRLPPYYSPPLHPAVSSSHTLLNQSSFTRKCLRFGMTPHPPPPTPPLDQNQTHPCLLSHI